MFRVYDDRNPEITLHQSISAFASMNWITDNYPEEHEDFSHIWMEKVKD